ncbi:MAG TPA: T6SS immunity protein Tdi1 domain-containing protein [Acidobacteriaceae bacterium]|nr:T6SS immunity protein Tdi1 domain-containing protein [Acidobacteriaceae bacterium]
MFENFERKFRQDASSTTSAGAELFTNAESYGLSDLFERYAGATFESGLYRVITPEIGRLAEEFIREAFLRYEHKIASFATDWLGRIFCVDSTRKEGDQMAILMLEPGTGEALEIPANLMSFHEEELIEYANAALAQEWYREWLSAGGQAPRFDECIGYRKLLFLGGKDISENLERVDLDVYWTISAQLIRKTRELPHGTRIGKISGQ